MKGKAHRLHRIIAAITLIVMFAVALTGTAFADASDTVAFADSNLEAALLSLPGADADSSGDLTEGEMAALRGTLDLSSLAISDITGLQYATGISGLNLSDNLIRDISALGSFSLISIDVTSNCLDTAEGSDDMAVITALQTAGCTVTCDSQKTPVTGVTLDHDSLTLCVGDTAVLMATVSPEAATVQAVIWASENDEIVSVADDTVTAVNMGTARVTAVTQDGGFEAVCTVTVKANKIGSPDYRVDTGTISGVAKCTGVDAFKGKLYNDASDICVYKADGSILTSGNVGTGMSVVLTVEGVERDRLSIIVNGDTNGDGLISISDYTLTRYQILALKQLEGAYRLAGDVNGDGNVSISDYTLIRYDILGLRLINNASPSSPDLPEVSDPRIRAFLDIALAQQGDPYVWGDEGPDGFDCSGFVYYCLKQSGYTGTLWRSTADTYSRWSSWQYVSRDALQPGDLMFYYSDNPSDGDHIGHIGIYLGNGYHIHASSSYGYILICRVEGWYDTMLSHGRRVFY